MIDSGWREESEKEEDGEELLFSASVIPVLKAVTLWEMPLLTGVRQEQGAPLVPGKAKYGQGAGTHQAVLPGTGMLLHSLKQKMISVQTIFFSGCKSKAKRASPNQGWEQPAL